MPSTTLTRGVTTIELPEDLQWTDEFAWTPVGQVVTPTLTGALIIEEAAQQAGRPITLVSQRNGATLVAVVTRTTVAALQAMAAIAGARMTLTLSDARVFEVAWRHDGGSAFTAEAMKHIVPPEPGDLYLITLKFMQV